MKETGVTRTLDGLGRVVIPVEIRSEFDLMENDRLEFYVEEDKIIVKKYINSCIFCNAKDNLTKFEEKYICPECLREIKDLK